MRKLLLPLLLFFFPLLGLGQSITLKVTSGVKIFAGDSATVEFTITAESFNYQLYLSVASSELPTGSTVFFPVNPVEYPYSNASGKVKVGGGAQEGIYVVVFKAANGPVESYDTCLVEIVGQNCDWFTTVSPYALAMDPVVVSDTNNNQWLLGGNTFAKYSNGSWTNYAATSIGLPFNTQFTALNVDQNNNVWMGSQQGLTKYTPSTGQVVQYNTTNSQIASNVIYSIDFDDDNKVWLGTDRGAVLFDGAFWTNYTISNSSLTSNIVKRVRKGFNGNIWLVCATTSGSDELVSFDGSVWTLYTPQTFCVGYLDIRDFGTDPSGRIWLVTNNVQHSILRKDHEHIHIWGNMIGKEYEMRSSTGCSLLNEMQLPSFDPKPGKEMAINDNGDVWIAGNLNEIGSLMGYVNNDWRNYDNTRFNLPDSESSSISIDGNGTVWSTFRYSYYHNEGPYLSSFSCNDPLVTGGDIPEVKVANELQISPNPTSTEVILKSLFFYKNVNVTIINSQGVEVLIIRNLTPDNYQIAIDVYNLSDGIYLINVDNNEQNFQSKFVKR